MRRRPAGVDAIFASRMLRALAITTLIVGTSVHTAEASWELHIDVPGATYQTANDISSNRRFVVGFYCAELQCSNFLWHDGELSTISVPGTQDTYLTAVNAAGDVAGWAWSSDTAVQLAFLRAPDGTITPITCPFSPSLRPTAINNGGTVVGTWYNTDGDTGAFRWRDGQCEQLPIRDGFTFPTDISTNGIIVGGAGLTGELEPSYAFMIQRDEVTVIEYPEVPFALGGITVLNAVATNGLAVGWSSPDIASVIHGTVRWFLYRDGVFESVDVPGQPRDFHPLSISSSGVVIYEDVDNVIRTVRLTSALAQQ